MLSRMEVTLLLKLSRERTISQLAKELDISIYRASTLVTSLERKGLVKTGKKGKHKRVSPSDAKPAELFRRLTHKFSHMPLEVILSGKTLALLAVLKAPLGAHEICLRSNLSRSTFYHIVDRLSSYGILGKRKKERKYFLIERYRLFHEFAKEFCDLQNSIKAREFSQDSAVVWGGVGEFILSTREYRGKKAGNFHLTGVERFGDFGLDLIGTGQYHYYYSEKVKELSLENIVTHALLIDFSPRTILYSAVLLLAHRDKISERKLFELGKKYDVSVKNLLGLLEGKEAGRYPYPSIKEVEETFRAYFGEEIWTK
ncbi:hypothetical protein Asulf_00063 [Archaeoglobus sulfaticallidus PM70-1]|uniref:HVO-2833 C-terminal domain-containing protein n=1 Tax=Archaeoglobus sulfaticallidus PM70-1 TaxID=387631 RepID=N0B8Z7_9EURY|nr:helix-turn-helix domain-containing protein [Archaeoglobus sulfaticallidus]AGK60099.1 hypothetical protein Asulf_00063 [Archaeoglobus sulfaticallidus PM70-1]